MPAGNEDAAVHEVQDHPVHRTFWDDLGIPNKDVRGATDYEADLGAGLRNSLSNLDFLYDIEGELDHGQPRSFPKVHRNRTVARWR